MTPVKQELGPEASVDNDARVEAAVAEERARVIVSMLMARDGWQAHDIALVLGLSRSSVSMRLTGRVKFTIGDLHLLSMHFQVSPELFFQDPVQLMSRRSISGSSGSVWIRSLRLAA